MAQYFVFAPLKAIIHQAAFIGYGVDSGMIRRILKTREPYEKTWARQTTDPIASDLCLQSCLTARVREGLQGG